MNENRFLYLTELSDEELIKLKEDTIAEIEYIEKLVDSPTTSSEQRSELINSDLPYNEDLLKAVNNLISAREIRIGR